MHETFLIWLWHVDLASAYIAIAIYLGAVILATPPAFMLQHPDIVRWSRQGSRSIIGWWLAGLGCAAAAGGALYGARHLVQAHLDRVAAAAAVEAAQIDYTTQECPDAS